MKICRLCHKLIPFSDFYVSKHYKDGYTNACKECIRARARARARANPIRAIQKVQAYRKTAAGKRTMRKARKRAYYRYPEKEKARVAVRKAIANGILTPQPCAVCGEVKGVESHHDDYNKPLEVKWLCSLHHKEADKARRKAL